LVGRHDSQLGALVLDHDRVAAYCLHGVRGRVVVTSGAVAHLRGEELEAVLAHESAHLRARHDLVLAAATAMQRAFPFVPLFRVARA
jgi:Zn-dependent protease with chaperone function